MCTGFSDANGSWKIICTRRQYARNRRPPRTVTDVAVQPDVAGRARVELGQQPGHGGLARAGLADQGGDPAPAQGEVTSSTACTARVAPGEQVAQPPADREMLGQAVGLQHHLGDWRRRAFAATVMPMCPVVGCRSRACRSTGRPVADADPEPCGYATGQEAGLRCRTTSSAFSGSAGRRAYGLASSGQPIQCLVLYSPPTLRGRRRDHRHLLDHDLLQGVHAPRRGSRRRSRLRTASQRLGGLGAVEAPVVAGGAAGADRLEHGRRP